LPAAATSLTTAIELDSPFLWMSWAMTSAQVTSGGVDWKSSRQASSKRCKWAWSRIGRPS
jgi:hypothetical protein